LKSIASWRIAFQQDVSLREQGTKLLISCEHGGSRIPPQYRSLFLHQQYLLSTHKGFDIGALDRAKILSRHFSAPLFYSEISRLLVDLNRSIGRTSLFSEATRSLGPADKGYVLENFYHPYRDAVLQKIEKWIAGKIRVLHISVHSFTPVLNGRIRRCDVGLLYDPSRQMENLFCRLWKHEIGRVCDNWVVRRNYPYLGISDGLTSCLRKMLPENRYLGVELEINQKMLTGTSRHERTVFDNRLAESLDQAMIRFTAADHEKNRPRGMKSGAA
jgi:predicted N-formylglutamate amidohydrolase